MKYFSYIFLGDIMIVKEGRIVDNNLSLDTVEVVLDNTTLLIISGYGGFAMCGALNVDVYNKLAKKGRNVLCMRAIGVKTLEDLYDAKIEDLSDYAISLGLTKGMYVKDAFKKISIQ